jgi:hypothetical protein
MLELPNHRNSHRAIARRCRALDRGNGLNPEDCQTWLANVTAPPQFHILSVCPVSWYAIIPIHSEETLYVESTINRRGAGF